MAGMEKDINLEKKDSADSVKQSTSKRQNTDATTALDEERIHSSIDSSIRPADVLCGRGKPSFNHIGNKEFRDAITNSLDEYNKSETRFDKQIVVHDIVQKIQLKGGRFLKQDNKTGKWEQLTAQQSKEKVGHAIRDAVNSHDPSKHKRKLKPSSSNTNINQQQNDLTGYGSDDFSTVSPVVTDRPTKRLSTQSDNPNIHTTTRQLQQQQQQQQRRPSISATQLLTTTTTGVPPLLGRQNVASLMNISPRNIYEPYENNTAATTATHFPPIYSQTSTRMPRTRSSHPQPFSTTTDMQNTNIYLGNHPSNFISYPAVRSRSLPMASTNDRVSTYQQYRYSNWQQQQQQQKRQQQLQQQQQELLQQQQELQQQQQEQKQQHQQQLQQQMPTQQQRQQILAQDPFFQYHQQQQETLFRQQYEVQQRLQQLESSIVDQFRDPITGRNIQGGGGGENQMHHQDQHYEYDNYNNDDHFLATIDDVLGPLPSDGIDLMEPIMHGSSSSIRISSRRNIPTNSNRRMEGDTESMKALPQGDLRRRKDTPPPP